MSINLAEVKVVSLIATIFSFRIMGLFMLLPVISSYINVLSHANKANIGIALGIYGLTQVIFQIPFSILSDRWGRIKTIVLGLIIFAIGSIIAALSTSITWFILGRALQGAGATGSVLLALVADVTREGSRTIAMAIIGISIGASFSVAIVLGSILFATIGGASIFYCSAFLAILGIMLLFFVKKQYVQNMNLKQSNNFSWNFLMQYGVLDSRLFALHGSIFLLHAIFSAIFLLIPDLLINLGIIKAKLWLIYVPVLIMALIPSLWLMRLADRVNYLRQVMLGAILSLLLSIVCFKYFSSMLSGIFVALLLFFTAFNLLEALLPSAVSKLAPVAVRGSVMGIFSTFQFLGIFTGGSLGGLINYQYGSNGIILACCLLVCLWLFIINRMNFHIKI